jgi:RHS repeat-associated protein
MLTASGSTQYSYDALDQRVVKTGGSYPTETIYFLGRPIAFHNPSSGAYTDLIWAGGREIATVAGTQTAQPVFRLLDHEGSLVMTTDSSGNVTGSNVLSPYGQKISSNTTDAYSYAGLYQDTEYGGDAATFRNYSEEQVRWTRPDPYNGSYDVSNPQSMNRYVYAMNNPLALTDPSGLDCVYDEGGGNIDIVTGDCYSTTDNGYYYDGTINTAGSFILNPDGSLDFGFTSSNGATGIASILGFADPTSDFSFAGYNGFNDSGENSSDGMGCSAQCAQIFRGADMTVHGLAIGTAGMAAVPFVAPLIPTAARVAGQLIQELELNPSTWTTVGDFASGTIPASSPPATFAGLAGQVSSWLWDRRKQ